MSVKDRILALIPRHDVVLTVPSHDIGGEVCAVRRAMVHMDDIRFGIR